MVSFISVIFFGSIAIGLVILWILNSPASVFWTGLLFALCILMVIVQIQSLLTSKPITNHDPEDGFARAGQEIAKSTQMHFNSRKNRQDLMGN